MNDHVSQLQAELHCIQTAGLPLPTTLPHPWSQVAKQQPPGTAKSPESPPEAVGGAHWRQVAHEVVDHYDRTLGHQGRPVGAIYTPRPLASAMVGWVWSHLDQPHLPRVLEPGCGAGRLLIPLVEALRTHAGAETPERVLGALVAEELNPEAAAVARRVIWLALEGRAPWPLNPDPVAVVDTLAPERLALGPFDAVVGNPPYAFGEAIAAERRRALDHFQLAQGTSPDLFRLFIEATLPRVRSGGVHALLVPDALLARDALRDVRRWFVERARLLGIGRCGQPFETHDRRGRRRSVATGAIVVVGRRRPVPPPYTRPVVRSWEGSHFGPPHPIEPISSTGNPWEIAAPDWWWRTPEPLRASLEDTSQRVGDVLLPGTLGATRGEETGRRTLIDLTSPSCQPVLTGHEIGRMQVRAPRAGLLPEAIHKPDAIYAGPRVLVVKTGSTPVAAADIGHTVVLQSVYILHLAPHTPWDPWTLAATLASAWLGVYTLYRWTAVKAVQPQLTLANVRALPLPNTLDFDALRPLARRLHDANLTAQERTALEHQCDTVIGAGFGLDLDHWELRLATALRSLPASQRPCWCPQRWSADRTFAMTIQGD
ncbi:MAG: N-6 DNA methylase [Myxococcota bacterium]